MSGKNEALELMRALNEVTKCFRQTGPLFLEVLGLMRKATSGENAFGYFEAAGKIDDASVDDKDTMLLLGMQFLGQILDVIAADPFLKATFQEKFPESQLFKGL